MFTEGNRFRSKSFFPSVQLVVGVTRLAKAFVHSTNLSYEILFTTSSSLGFPLIDFCKAFNSIKCSKLHKNVFQSNAWNSCFYQFLLFTIQPYIFLQNCCESGIQQRNQSGFCFFDALPPYRKNYRIVVKTI